MVPHCWIIRRWRRPVLGLSIVALLAPALLALGCADPQKRYEVLSFFFDGVPDPNAPQGQSGRIGSQTGRITFVHKPYADNQCNSCHLNTNDIFARAQVREDICLSCHADVPTQHAVMHGPVVNNACQMCHSPHSSAIPALLRQPAPAVCTQCHEPEGLKLMHSQPVDLTASCLDCHSGHGGSDHSMLLSAAHRRDQSPSSTQPTLPVESGVPR